MEDLIKFVFLTNIFKSHGGLALDDLIVVLGKAALLDGFGQRWWFGQVQAEFLLFRKQVLDGTLMVLELLEEQVYILPTLRLEE